MTPYAYMAAVTTGDYFNVHVILKLISSLYKNIFQSTGKIFIEFHSVPYKMSHPYIET